MNVVGVVQGLKGMNVVGVVQGLKGMNVVDVVQGLKGMNVVGVVQGQERMNSVDAVQGFRGKKNSHTSIHPSNEGGVMQKPKKWPKKTATFVAS